MSRFITTTKRIFVTSFVMLLAGMPLAGVTSGIAAADDTCTAPSSSDAGVHVPVGSDASTFTYQCDGQYAGKWTNPYYAYDPATQLRTPLYDPQYGYNCNTGTWTMLAWYYSPSNKTFYSTRIQTGFDPGLATDCPVTAAPVSGSGTGTTGGSGSGSGISNTGPNSTNSTSSNSTTNSNTTNNTNVLLNNAILSQATSGNSNVSNNTIGGSALTGDATSTTNVANVLQSSSNVFGPNTVVFSADINGDVNGDFMFDPSAVLSDTGPNSTNSAKNNLTVNTNNTNNTNAQINNNIDAGATSGNASVTGNTNGGDATSGNAHAIVNLMNVINSTISSGSSFVGTININGNLNGDILLPANLINQLLASTGPNSNNTADSTVTDNSTTTNNNNLGINNDVTSTAQTGDANVSNNSSAGSATTGSANTSTDLLNLTGSSVVGKDDLLVYVNVLGQWHGMIVNAPAGSTAASLGGGITTTGPNSTNSTDNNVTNNSNTTNNTNQSINNKVNVHAQSGSANVSGNTSGGNATSGNADTAVNIVNINGVNINLSDWFGVLFINVFGNWNGSFGVNTSAGDPAATSGGAVNAGFQFVPNPAVADADSLIGGGTTTSTTNASGSGATSGTNSDGTVLGSSVKKAAASLPTTDIQDNAAKAFNKLLIPAVGITIAFIILVVGERRQARALRR